MFNQLGISLRALILLLVILPEEIKGFAPALLIRPLSDVVTDMPTTQTELCHNSKSVQTKTRQQLQRQSRRHPPQHASALFAGNADDDAFFLDSDDPFVVLQISSPTADAKEIKKAFRRMAVRHHPDVATNKDSTPEEKKLANDRFAKINWAYQTLSGKNGDARTSTSTSQQSTSSSGGWTPPHRRSGSTYSNPYTSSSSGKSASTDWRDYIPNYRKEQENSQYDTGGDSFEAIFADLFQAAGSGAMGGGGILKDFVEFLEQGGVSGFAGTGSGSSAALDQELQVLLQTGSLDEIAEEMDDSALVEQQLETKLDNLRNDVITLTADLQFAQKVGEKMKVQEELAEAKARVPIVEDYLRQARKRLVALRTRYKELIVRGERDTKVGTGGASVWDEIKREASSSGGSSSTTSSRSSRTSETSSSSSSGRQSAAGTSSSPNEDAWKSDSFGSFGRGRGSRGRGRSRRTTTTSSSSSSSTSTSDASSANNSRRSSSSYSSTSGSRSRSTSSSARTTTSPSSQRPTTTTTTAYSNVPPHRRPLEERMDDKRRLRELKVDEEFDKLKKDLGL